MMEIKPKKEVYTFPAAYINIVASALNLFETFQEDGDVYPREGQITAITIKRDGNAVTVEVIEG